MQTRHTGAVIDVDAAVGRTVTLETVALCQTPHIFASAGLRARVPSSSTDAPVVATISKFARRNHCCDDCPRRAVERDLVPVEPEILHASLEGSLLRTVLGVLNRRIAHSAYKKVGVGNLKRHLVSWSHRGDIFDAIKSRCDRRAFSSSSHDYRVPLAVIDPHVAGLGTFLRFAKCERN